MSTMMPFDETDVYYHQIDIVSHNRPNATKVHEITKIRGLNFKGREILVGNNWVKALNDSRKNVRLHFAEV